MYSALKNILLFAALLNIIACGGNTSEKADTVTEEQVEISAIRDITVQQASTLLDKNRNILLIDVRTEGEFVGPLGHIEGSRLLPIQQFKHWAPQLDTEKERPIMLVCRSGGRSGRVAVMLKERGFSNLMNVKGGMSAWNKTGLPIAVPE